jgi:hypothetical protein
MWLIRDLGLHTAILDTYRDAGLTQGILSGNYWGDPTTSGAWRYYPPLFASLASLGVQLTGVPALQLLICVAPWFNLLVPIAFFWVVRRMLNAPAAALATVVLVCVNGAVLPPWDTITYSPWSSAPMFAAVLFFCSLWLLIGRIHLGRLLDALLIGSAIGITSLANPVPAAILATITAAAAVTTYGIRWRTLGWVALAAAVAFVWSLPFTLPLLVHYHLTIANTVPGHHTDEILVQHLPFRIDLELAASFAVLALLIQQRRRRAADSASDLACVILAVWLIVPTFFLARHYACGASVSNVCTAFVVPVHHWLVYTQAATACLFGYAAYAYRPDNIQIAKMIGIASGVLACALILFRPMDFQMRKRALSMEQRVDLPLYQWIVTNTAPAALFASADMSVDVTDDPASLAVLTAGRRSIAIEPTFSNPYVAWNPREQRLRFFVDVATDSNKDESGLCALQSEAGRGGQAYIALRTRTVPRSDGMRLVFRGRMTDVYLVKPENCIWSP